MQLRNVRVVVRNGRSPVVRVLDTTLHFRKSPNRFNVNSWFENHGKFRKWRVVSKTHSTCDLRLGRNAPVIQIVSKLESFEIRSCMSPC